MPSITDSAAQLAAAGVPVAFLDTCSILDVIRAPERGLTGCVEAASQLLAMTTASPPLCLLVVGSLVPNEWNGHAQLVLGKLTAYLDQLDKQTDRLHTICGHLGISLAFGTRQYGASGLAARLHGLSQQLLGAAIALDSHPDTINRSHARVLAKRRPCRKGGGLEDCTIFEECLEVCRQLRALSFSPKLVFCTSNIDDYCAPGITPHADIDADCAGVGLRFTTNLPWAVSELKT